MSTYLPPCRECEAAVAVHVVLNTIGGLCRPTLPPRRGCEAAVGKLAVLTWSSLDAEVDLPAASP